MKNIHKIRVARLMRHLSSVGLAQVYGRVEQAYKEDVQVLEGVAQVYEGFTQVYARVDQVYVRVALDHTGSPISNWILGKPCICTNSQKIRYFYLTELRVNRRQVFQDEAYKERIFL
eukprot:NP_509160.1 Uncharacterized protein CELE_F41C6.3 [Caenorhabditis elegans]